MDKLEQLTLSCMRCGNCRAVCPIFDELGEEASSPRGRVRLIKGISSGEVELSRRYQELVGICMNCRACAEECPSGVEPNIAVLNAREHLVNKKGLNPIKRLIFRYGMRGRRMFPAGAKLMGLAERATLIRSPLSPARLVLPLMGLPIDKQVPYFALKSFLDRTPEINPADNRKFRVGYFVGCSANLIQPEVGEAVVGLLNHFGVEVVVPKSQMCCGTPLFNSGDFEGAVWLAERNLRAFADLDVDAIITSCGSCGLTLKHEWSEVMGIDVPQAFLEKVRDFAEFITDCLGIEDLGGEMLGRVTYHDSCHLARGMGVRSQPRGLLASTGMELVEMKEPSRCCGGAGAFSIYHPALSRKVGQRKADDILGTEAEIATAGCVSCVMQMSEMLSREGSSAAARHTACVLWDAVKNKA